MPEIIGKILPVAAKVLPALAAIPGPQQPLIAGAAAATNLGQGIMGLTGAGGAADKLQIPQIPKFGGGAAPSMAPPPPDFPITPGSGLSPGSTSGFTAPSATASSGPAGGGDFSAAIAKALAEILGPGGQMGSPQSGDAFSGQFGG